MHVFVVARAGLPPPDVAGCPEARGRAQRLLLLRTVADARAAQATVLQVAGLTDVSSTAVRAALAAGGDGGSALRASVLAYAREHALYGACSAAPPPA